VKGMAGAAAGTFLVNRGAMAAGALLGQTVAPAKRREIVIGGRRIKTVDVHAHCFVPEVWDVVKDWKEAESIRNNIEGPLRLGPARLQYMDEQGVDVQALSINPWFYWAERDRAQRIIAIQNEKIAEWCARYPDRFVGLASVALQHPDLAAAQLDEAVKKMGMRGAAIGGSVEGQELSAQKFDPFWAKAQELGVVVFMHPQGAPGTTRNDRLQGKGGLGNTIGNPLETTVALSHLIFEGTFDRFPGLRVCAAHAGGYLPSYLGRSDARCGRGGGDCPKKRPSEYFRREIIIDSMVFREDGLRHLVAEVGVEQIVYGTDYPFDWPVGLDFILRASFLSDAEKEAIVAGNLARLLRIGS